MASMTSARRAPVEPTRAADSAGSVRSIFVDGFERGVDRLGLGLVGGADGGLDAADDQAHQVHDRGEEDLLGVLLLGDVFEELVDQRGAEGVLHEAPSHDGQWGILGKPLENVAEDHGCCLREGTVTPYQVAA